MNRRQVLQGALAGAGSMAGAGNASAASQNAVGPVAQTGTAVWKPLLFDNHQNETVTLLTELIIPRTDTPGARDAKVNEYIDLILHDGQPERRSRFIQGLGWLDGYAIRQHGGPFLRLSGAQQVNLLKSLDTSTDASLQPGAEFFRQAKQLTVQGYYTSRAGVDELNKGGSVPGSVGCAHEGKHSVR
ncbi:MAG: gluconate 2-dehydrogenase subunit 3 family protein [Bryobacteraceae bacterium]|nr:gluconate 2-dehydrogenase subunit 3 family protein [Bryobacteraceae bacterium]